MTSLLAAVSVALDQGSPVLGSEPVSLASSAVFPAPVVPALRAAALAVRAAEVSAELVARVASVADVVAEDARLLFSSPNVNDKTQDAASGMGAAFFVLEMLLIRGFRIRTFDVLPIGNE